MLCITIRIQTHQKTFAFELFYSGQFGFALTFVTYYLRFELSTSQTGFFTRLLPFSYLLEVKHHLIQTTFLSNLATCSDSELPARNPLPSPPPPLQRPPPISFTGHRNLLPPLYPLQPLWIRSFGPIYLTTSSTTSSLSSLSKPSSLSDQHPSISGL